MGIHSRSRSFSGRTDTDLFFVSPPSSASPSPNALIIMGLVDVVLAGPEPPPGVGDRRWLEGRIPAAFYNGRLLVPRQSGRPIWATSITLRATVHLPNTTAYSPAAV